MSSCRLAKLGVGEIPNEARVVSAMQSAAMPEYVKKYEQSPHGLLVYHPASGAPFAAAVARGGVLNLVEGLLVAWLLSWAAPRRGYRARVGFAVIAGILATLTTNVEYWNWYEFTSNHVPGYLITHVIAYTFVGLTATALVKSEIAARS